MKDILIIPTEDIRRITPGHEKVLALQKPDRILKSISRVLIPGKCKNKLPNFMKSGWVTKML